MDTLPSVQNKKKEQMALTVVE